MPGMGLGDCEKWWGKGGLRDRPHEGVDLCYFEKRDGGRHFLKKGAKIPFIDAGEIVAICKDFLGHSVFVKSRNEDLGDVIVVYAHILPCCKQGDSVRTGEVCGEVSPATGILAHLHLSLILAPPQLKYENLNWQYLNSCEKDIFLNPFCHQ